MTDAKSQRPAFYAASGGPWRDWWTLLHPPYTAWHLSYVVIGACLVPRPTLAPLLATLLAFFLAVGVSAHALDELNGRPLRTSISRSALVAAAVVGLVGASALGIAGVWRQGPVLLPFIVVGAFLVVAYNAEMFGGRFHNDLVFALAWGAFPVLTAAVAESRSIRPAAVLAASGAFALSTAQRQLSTQARMLRRSVRRVEGSVEMIDGSVTPLDQETLLLPIERALRALVWGLVLVATALAVERFT